MQELIAPKDVEFYDSRWLYFGDRGFLLDPLFAITNIEPAVLTHTVDLSGISVAKKMSWAAHRFTFRLEDKAYCLLGLFDVKMPMLYDEGAKSFRRLQEEILRSSNDHTIFAWGVDGHRQSNDLLAASPADFTGSENVVPWGMPGLVDITTHNLRIDMPVFKAYDDAESRGMGFDGSIYVGILNCRLEDAIEASLGLTLKKWAGQDRYTVACEEDFSEISRRSAAVTSIPFTTQSFAWPSSQLINIAWRSQTLVPEVNSVFRLKEQSWIPRPLNSYFPSEGWNPKRTVLRPPKSQAFHNTIGGVHIPFAGGQAWAFIAFTCKLSDVGRPPISVTYGSGNLGPALLVTDNMSDTEYQVSQPHAPELYQRLSGKMLIDHMDNCHPFQPCGLDCPFKRHYVERHYNIDGEAWRLSAAIRGSYVQGDPSFLVDVEVMRYSELDSDLHGVVGFRRPAIELPASEIGRRSEEERAVSPVDAAEDHQGADLSSLDNGHLFSRRYGMLYRPDRMFGSESQPEVSSDDGHGGQRGAHSPAIELPATEVGRSEGERAVSPVEN